MSLGLVVGLFFLTFGPTGAKWPKMQKIGMPSLLQHKAGPSHSNDKTAPPPYSILPYLLQAICVCAQQKEPLGSSWPLAPVSRHSALEPPTKRRSGWAETVQKRQNLPKIAKNGKN